jgi:uncharacterized protein (DUF2147 family)
MSIPFLIGVAAAAGLVGALPATAAAQRPPVGVWETIDDDTHKPTSHVFIYERDGKLFGKIIKLLVDPPDSECDKCKGSRKNQRIIGMEILWDLKKDGDVWSGGRILDPKNGKDYRAKIWLEGNNRLKVRGYWFIFYRTQDWRYVGPQPTS